MLNEFSFESESTLDNKEDDVQMDGGGWYAARLKLGETAETSNSDLQGLDSPRFVDKLPLTRSHKSLKADQKRPEKQMSIKGSFPSEYSEVSGLVNLLQSYVKTDDATER
jgi:hypothetical protein